MPSSCLAAAMRKLAAAAAACSCSVRCQMLPTWQNKQNLAHPGCFQTYEHIYNLTHADEPSVLNASPTPHLLHYKLAHITLNPVHCAGCPTGAPAFDQ